MVVKKLQPKMSMVIASLFYSLWIISLALTSAALKNETIREMLSYNAIAVMVLGVGFISGAGCSLLWIA